MGDTLELPKLGPGKPTRHTAHNSAEVGPVLPGPRSPQSVADSALVISRLAWGQGALGLTACGSEWGLVSQGAPVWCQQKKPQVRVGQRQRRSGVTLRFSGTALVWEVDYAYKASTAACG